MSFLRTFQLNSCIAQVKMFQSSSPTKIQAIAVTFNLVPTEGLPTPFKKLCKIYVFIWMLLSFFFSYIVNHFSIRLNQVHSP